MEKVSANNLDIWGEKAALAPGAKLSKLYWRSFLGSLLLCDPVTQAQELPYLAAFVAIFLGFGRSIIGLAEGVFGISDSVLNQVQCLCHTQSFFNDGLPASCGSARSLSAQTVACFPLVPNKGKIAPISILYPPFSVPMSSHIRATFLQLQEIPDGEFRPPPISLRV